MFLISCKLVKGFSCQKKETFILIVFTIKSTSDEKQKSRRNLNLKDLCKVKIAYTYFSPRGGCHFHPQNEWLVALYPIWMKLLIATKLFIWSALKISYIKDMWIVKLLRNINKIKLWDAPGSLPKRVPTPNHKK